MITKAKYDKAVQTFLKALGYDPAEVVAFRATAGSPMEVDVLVSTSPYRVMIKEVHVAPAPRQAPKSEENGD